MKHKVRCIEKRSYLTLKQVYRAVIQNYVANKDALAWYECAICLCFHLTSQKDMRNKRLRKKCSVLYLNRWYPSRISTHQLIFERGQQMISLLRKDRKEREAEKQKRKEQKERWKEMGWTKKTSILPLDEQKKLLSNLNQK